MNTERRLDANTYAHYCKKRHPNNRKLAGTYSRHKTDNRTRKSNKKRVFTKHIDTNTSRHESATRQKFVS